MFLRNHWFSPLWEGEGAGGATGTEGSTSTGGSGSGDGGVAPQGLSEQQLSLRAQLASQLDETTRPGFESWAQKYTTDKEFVLGAMNMRQDYDRRVPVPAPDAKPEEKARYFQRVGMPKEAKEYVFDFGADENGKPVQLDDADRQQFEAYREFAYKHNFTQEQFEKGLQFRNEDLDRQQTLFNAQIDAAHRRAVEGLKAEWGVDYESNVVAATEGGINYFGSEQAWSEFVNLPLQNGMLVGDHPSFIKAWGKVGRSIAEDQRVRDLRHSGEADSVQAEIHRIENEALAAGKSPSAPEYYARLRPLYTKLHGSKPISGQGANGFGV